MISSRESSSIYMGTFKQKQNSSRGHRRQKTAVDGELLLERRGCRETGMILYLFPSPSLHLSLKQPPDVGAIKHSLDKQGTFKKKLIHARTHSLTHTHTAIINLRNENGPSGEKIRLCSSAPCSLGPASAPGDSGSLPLVPACSPGSFS